MQGLGSKEDLGLDELVATRCNVHIERLGNCGFYVSVQLSDGKELVLWLASNRKIGVTHEWRSVLNSGTPQAEPEAEPLFTCDHCGGPPRPIEHIDQCPLKDCKPVKVSSAGASR